MNEPLLEMCNRAAGWLNGESTTDPHWPADWWAMFKQVARVHGIAPLLHECLSGASWLNDPLRNWLAGQHQHNAQRIERMQAELTELLALFARHNLPVMPLKGSILAVEYYPAPGLRPMADLDLLIRPHEFDRAAALLAQLGYRQEVAHWKHTEFCKPDNRRVISKKSEHPDNPRKLELHLHCRESFGGPTVNITPLMWEQAVEGRLLGQTAQLPTPEALWLHLLLHAGYHLWQGRGRLIQLFDLRLLAAHLPNPQSYVTRIDARYTFPALSLLHRTLPGSIEPSLVAAQQKRVSPRFAAWGNTLNLVNASYLNPNPTGLYLRKALRFADGRPTDTAKALRFAFLPDINELSLDHPRLARSRLRWLTYTLLPLDWLKRLGVGRDEKR